MWRTLCCLIALTGCASTPVRAPGPELFEFHDSFWLNLHQLLLAEGRPRRRPVPGPPREDPRWVAAIEAYRKDLSQRFFLDDELARINGVLARGQLEGVPVRAALEVVAPLFREAEWAEDQRRSAAWVAAARVLLARHGAALAGEVSRVFLTPWPSAPIRVETSKQAGPFGAFSLGSPFFITLSTADPAYQGDASLEMLFHEAAHSLDGVVVAALEAECARRGVPVPEFLDHAILFFSVGELAKRQLGASYVPYAYANGLYARSPSWTVYEAALLTEWVPYLDGRVSLEAAVAAVIAKISK